MSKLDKKCLYELKLLNVDFWGKSESSLVAAIGLLIDNL